MPVSLAAQVKPWLLDAVYLFILGLIALVAPRLRAWYIAHTTAQQRAVLSSLAAAAVPYVEQGLPTLPGSSQADAAVKHVLEALAVRGIAISEQEVTAEVQRAYLDARKSGTLRPGLPPAPPSAPATPAK